MKRCLHRYDHDARGMLRTIYGKWCEASVVDENIKALIAERRALKREVKRLKGLLAKHEEPEEAMFNPTCPSCKQDRSVNRCAHCGLAAFSPTFKVTSLEQTLNGPNSALDGAPLHYYCYPGLPGTIQTDLSSYHWLEKDPKP